MLNPHQRSVLKQVAINIELTEQCAVSAEWETVEYSVPNGMSLANLLLKAQGSIWENEAERL